MRAIKFYTVTAGSGRGSLLYRTDSGLLIPWTVNSFDPGTPVLQTAYVTVPGRPDGQIDQSTVLSDGAPVYTSRKATATLTISDRFRANWRSVLNTFINTVDGKDLCIFGPDDQGNTAGNLYLRGRVSVSKVDATPYRAKVTLTAMCEPWRYEYNGTTAQSATGRLNITPTAASRRPIEPQATVGSSCRVALYTVSGSTETVVETWTLTASTWTTLYGLVILPGETARLKTQIYNSTTQTWTDSPVTLTVSYREGYL